MSYNENNKTITVVVPFYNVGKMIENSVKSLVKQTNYDFEVVFVNDGSTDNSKDFLLFLLKHCDFPYKIVDKKNKGVSAARNVGISEAKGRFIYFLDADDIIVDDFMEKILNRINECNDLIIFGYNILDDNSHLIKQYNFDGYEDVVPSEKILEDILKFKISIHTGSIIYRREFLLTENLRFSENMCFGEDQEFSMLAVHRAEKVNVLNEQLFCYLKHSTSTTSRKFDRTRYGILQKYFSLKNELKKEEIYLSVCIDGAIIMSSAYLSSVICSTLNFRDSIKEMSYMCRKYLKDIAISEVSYKYKTCYLVIKYFSVLFYITLPVFGRFVFPVSKR